MPLVCLLRSGGEYTPEHVETLRRQLARSNPEMDLVCFADTPTSVETIPLKYDWPGWWAKFELFRPDIKGTLFYCDLDTVILRSLKDLASATGSVVLRDFYRLGDTMGSGLMRMTEADRHRVWQAWIADPAGWMERCRRGGDQSMLEHIFGSEPSVRRWQDVVPGKVLSYKADLRKNGWAVPPAEASIICFHGRPRPWHAADSWIREAADEPLVGVPAKPVSEDRWATDTVFIIGGGPSAARENLDALRGRGIVVAVNDSARALPWADVVFTADMSWLQRRADFVRAFTGARVATGPADFAFPDIPDLQTPIRIDGVGLTSNPSATYATNSGFGAFTWAVAKGAKRIVLVGFDLTEAGHWHGGYEWKSRFGAPHYSAWSDEFGVVARDVAARGVQVINTNFESAIGCFPFARLTDIAEGNVAWAR